MKDETGKVVFDADEQQEVNRIVQERLSRHKPDDYDTLKELEKQIEVFGHVGTTAEKLQSLKAQAEAYMNQSTNSQKETEHERLTDKEEKGGLTPAERERLDKLEKWANRKMDEEERQKNMSIAQRATDTEFNKQYTELADKHKDVDFEELAKNEKYKRFIKGKNFSYFNGGKSGLTLLDVYEDFVEFIGDAEKEAIIKVKSKEERSTSSGKGSGSDGGTYGLTVNQQALAKEVGMTLKEYATSLSLIRKG